MPRKLNTYLLIKKPKSELLDYDEYDNTITEVIFRCYGVSLCIDLNIDIREYVESNNKEAILAILSERSLIGIYVNSDCVFVNSDCVLKSDNTGNDKHILYMTGEMSTWLYRDIMIEYNDNDEYYNKLYDFKNMILCVTRYLVEKGLLENEVRI